MPPGGWKFRTDKGIDLVGETFDLLVANVKTHFLYNGIPAVDFVALVEKQLVHRFPHMKKESVRA